MDMAHVESSAPSVSRWLYVLVSENGYEYATTAYVNHIKEGYIIEPDSTRNYRIKQEIEVRESVLDVALEDTDSTHVFVTGTIHFSLY